MLRSIHQKCKFFNQWLEKPRDNSPLIFFRVFFYAIMVWEAIHMLVYPSAFIANQPRPNFAFIGFEWLAFMNGAYKVPIIYLFLVSAVFSSVGLFYNISSKIVALLWSAYYFSDKVYYNNHYYLMVLLLVFMCLVPANKRFSLDVTFNITNHNYNCNNWCLQLFIGQVLIVYFFAGLAKLNAEWLSGYPLKIWLGNRTGARLIGPLFATEWFALFISYGGLVLDLLIAPLLLVNKYKKWAIALIVLFHLFNAKYFNIGTFPYTSILLVIFFVPELSKALLQKLEKFPKGDIQSSGKLNSAYTVLFGLYFLIQLLLPLRHFLIEGNVAWTEEGYRLSWRMMTRDKSGSLQFKIHHKESGIVVYEEPTKYVTQNALRRILACPDLIWQFAQFYKKIYPENQVAVYAITMVSINGKKPYPIVDSTKDLAQEQWHMFGHESWVTLHPILK